MTHFGPATLVFNNITRAGIKRVATVKQWQTPLTGCLARTNVGDGESVQGDGLTVDDEHGAIGRRHRGLPAGCRTARRRTVVDQLRHRRARLLRDSIHK